MNFQKKHKLTELIKKMINEEIIITDDQKINIDAFVEKVAPNDPELTEFIKKRLAGFDVIELKLNELIPLIKRAKQRTLTYYKENPNFAVVYGTDIATDYLDDLITLFKDEAKNSTGTV
jgi:hypothetical protein